MYYMEFPLEERLSRFIYRVFGFMALALLVTAGTAYYVSTVPALSIYFANPITLIILFLFQFILLIVLNSFMAQMQFVTAILLFVLWSALFGLTTSVIFLIYAQASIYTTFLVTASMFGVMAIYGYFTRTDLTAIGNLAFMALIGLIVGLLVNWWLRSPRFDFIISVIGVFVFTILTAFDVQRIKQIGQRLMADRQAMNKIAVLGAMTLYLDFLNLFLFLLRFTGKQRD
jgi:FtsH-binding integral membrane protein